MSVGMGPRQDAPRSLPAVADLRTKQYHLMKRSTGGMNICSSQGEQMCGILADKPNTGQHGSLLGQAGTKAPCVVGANGVTQDSEATTDTAGRAENAASGDWVFGIALETAAEGEQAQFDCVSPYVKA